jgi:hypothetical protein
MKFNLWTNNGAQNSKPVFNAFAAGAESLGHSVCYNSSDGDIDVIWSVLWHGQMARNKTIWDTNRTKSKPTIVLEVGGIKRGRTWKVAINGVNRDAYFGDTGNNSDRANLLGLSLKPWRTQGSHILIAGQHDKSLQWENMPRMSTWVMQTIEELKKHTDRSIYFRPHPRCRLLTIESQYKNVYRQDPQLVTGTYDDYDINFKDAWATISHSSNPGIQSIINGVPAFVSSSSLAYPVANNIDSLQNIEDPVIPDRQQWLNDYAHTEYTTEEISKGIPHKRLTSLL